jgi:beta-lactamase class A
MDTADKTEREAMVNTIFVAANKKKFIAAAAVVLLVFTAGFFCGWLMGKTGSDWNADQPMRQTRMGGYDFINPLLECDEGAQGIGSRPLGPFRDKVLALIDESKKKNWATHVSVYFREMNNGLTIGIDGQEKFTPASLIKVPLLIACLKIAESDPGFMQKKLAFTMVDNSSTQNIKPAEALETGRSYQVQDLLFRMIVYSDNNSYFLLLSAIDTNILHRVYTDLGLVVPKVSDRGEYMSVAEYASFFRVLFNASYLNKDLSEKALEYLAEVDFTRGLVAGVPPKTVVAHKFGEKTLGPNQEIKQLHDCGIVYYPQHPYLLCIMTRGDSFEYLDDTIKDISRLVFKEVDAHYRGR